MKEVGISRQLVHFHLTHLVQKGLIEKNGPIYFVPSMDRLVDVLVESNESSSGGRGYETPIFKENSKVLKDLVNQVLQARGVGITEANSMKSHLIDIIDDTIKSLKKEKNYLAVTNYSPRSSVRAIEKLGDNKWAAELYNDMTKALDYTSMVSLQDFQLETQDRIDDVNNP